MAVKIRLKRMGKIRTPSYRIVVADSRKKRDGRVIEEIGLYKPKTDPSLIRVDSDRAQHWLSVGAQPSEPVRALLRKTGDWQRFKGEPAPPPLRVTEPKKDQIDVFNQALQEAHGDSASEAVTAKKTTKKATKSAAADSAVESEPAAKTATPEEPAGAWDAAEEPAVKTATPEEPAGAWDAAEEPAVESDAVEDPVAAAPAAQADDAHDDEARAQGPDPAAPES